MNQVFKQLLEKHLKQFMASYHQEPKMFLQLGKDIKAHSETLDKSTQKFQEGAEEIVNLMAKQTYLVDLFTQIIADNQIEEIKPGRFLERADNAPDINPKESQEIIQTVAFALEQMASSSEDYTALYFENYFGEYLANIFLVSAIESFYDQKELFQQLKMLLDERNQSEEIFMAFMNATEVLKKDLETMYSYQNL